MGGQAELSSLPISLAQLSQSVITMKLTALMRGGALPLRESDPLAREHIASKKTFYFNAVTARGKFNMFVLTYGGIFVIYQTVKFIKYLRKKASDTPAQ